MNKLIQFLIQRVNLIIFLFLETLALVLYFSNNAYQGASFFNSSNQIAGGINDFSNDTREFMDLRNVNQILATENAILRNRLLQKKYFQINKDTLNIDSLRSLKYSFIPAKVINNSTDKLHNYLTINIGLKDSIEPGMGVICSQGIVGKIKSCSKNYATITSVLHKDIMISSKLKRNGAIGSLRWEGDNPLMAKLLFIPRHLEVKKGDTIISSEYNSVFPEGEMIGRVTSIQIKGDENFYTLNIRLSTDFNKLSYVYVIKNRFKIEQDSLENLNLIGKNESNSSKK